MNALFDAVRARSPCALRLRIRPHEITGIRRDLEYGADMDRNEGSGRRHSDSSRDNRDRRDSSDTRSRRGNDRGRHDFRRNLSAFMPTGRANRQVTLKGDPRKYRLFEALVDSRFGYVLKSLGPWSADNREMHAFGLHSQGELDRQAKLFRTALAQSMQLASTRGVVSRLDNPLFWSLRNAFVRGDTAGLHKELRYAFQSFILRPSLAPAVNTLQESIADFRFPYEWYPSTRTMQRTIHLHVGPTNSGKTYRALLALENAQTGIYAGPLRLLAHEIYARFVAKGRPCALITGEEQRFPSTDGTPMDPADPASGVAAMGGGGAADTYFQSCTVEMTPLNKLVDVAVIDEIQMIADPDRGWAWTQAFLGVQAREVHLCGEERAVNLIQALCARIGDKCIVHRYKRLSGLQTMKESLKGDFSNLRKGDAVVSFSRVALHTLKAGIESSTGRRCAIVYGSLPPETRAQQAALFNDPDNDYDFLVASDAIGMGLNLEVKRIIFETSTKHDGINFRRLSVPEVKQIGGRAGRYRTAAAAIRSDAASENKDSDAKTTTPETPAAGAVQKWGTPGFVTTLEDEDLPIVSAAFQDEAPPLQWAGIQPPTFAIEQFARYFPPDTPFSFILTRMRELAQVSDLFQMCGPKEMIEVADIIQPFRMTIYDRCIFMAAPTSLRDPGQKEVLQAFARCVSENSGGELLDIPEINLEILDVTDANDYPGGPSKYLLGAEALHKAITLYLWLSYRYVGVFSSQQLAFHVKGLVEAKIKDYLDNLTFVPERRRKRIETLRKMADLREKHDGDKRLLMEDGDEAFAAEVASDEAPASPVNTASAAGR
ncbi:mitochondrial ATP-dependent RNA helicase Suv3 [Sporothrix brasiliensis 5110]|uniref:RNA helicase n=1 Tax=Sporothrix brasiliensis 5110 TaxID=1398154 RepID=A0A0C2IU27_9PEZI|nr:mitochondrial ATP-dependent RNA helicase Suv3 [Sporothrix brasiliensis 5110]KIH90275.1 mitochondrial ATP-dependent RNA helicase Suv3 [Sporothrix brasiliensis 5110]